MVLGSVNFVKADCTLTSSQGTDGRCFLRDGEYVCLERSEDTTCFVSSETGPGQVG
ncbi:hypothetical protein DFQ04_3381 [Algoriphagus boseongensis]|uniref:Uncharacterized protein n=2 Tax=Algoriphagus boseongensis TaxID=1442587 RepID=A0A4R6T4H2_9BACT|nr:hypothetical protein DFQ04_3381 [Algoriphagus boseongensis]